MMTPEIIVSAPSDMETTRYVHRLSGVLSHSRPVAFRIKGDGIVPIFYPQLDENWCEVVLLPSGYLSACGREAITIQELCIKIRNGSNSNV